MASPASKTRRKSPPDPAPRKRRKRTVVTGAPDDCFTCAREGTRCDRRRPFCSQCLERGLGCSGYKTALKWGVGVASRGKLRGLSLPITGSEPVTTSGNPRPTRARNEEPLRGSLSSTNPGGDSAACTFPDLKPLAQQPSPTLEPATSFEFYDPFAATSPQAAVNHSPDSQSQGAKQCGQETADRRPPASVRSSASSAQLPWSASPRSQDSTGPNRNDDSGGIIWMTGCPEPSFSQLLLSRSVGRTPRLRYLISYYAEVIAPMIVAFDSPTNPFRAYILRLAHGSIALQEAIATLSASNLRSRQERRMRSTERTLPARMSSWAHRALTGGQCAGHYNTPGVDDLAQEEKYHRGRAVSALNLQLADQNGRLSDAVLATLLILCLFHGCDTGVAHFKTQFAGVTKILALRMHNSPEISDDLKWLIRVFTWYDTMTATTNNREVELRGVCLHIASVSDGEWGLENLAGCDAGLFKYVAQLGRLNVLSQKKVATTPALPDVFLPSATVPPNIAHSLPSDTVPNTSLANDCSSLPFSSHSASGLVEQGDPFLSAEFWTEWHAIRQKLESWRLQPRLLSAREGFSAAASSMASISNPPSESIVFPQNLDDIYHISESFRHAALLYTERLAHPHLPSTHHQIQKLVHRTMHHISLVKSDVYLLWPLFVAGSECVLEAHRAAIRQRCQDISKDSGFVNNLSCLAVLEKLWIERSAGDRGYSGISTVDKTSMMESMPTSILGDSFSTFPPSSLPTRNRGLRWQDVMRDKQSEGEYMVV